MEFNYNTLMGFKGKNAEHFQLMLPKSVKKEDNSLIFDTIIRAIPIYSIPQPVEQIHTNWIFSRMIEFAAWLNQVRSVNCGFSPDTIFITPENHGIIVISLLHLTPVNHKISTISGKYSSFYPSHIFKNKAATTDIDVEMSKRTALYLQQEMKHHGKKLQQKNSRGLWGMVKR